MTTKTTLRSIKIKYINVTDFNLQIENLGAKQIISIERCFPSYTDSNIWYSVYYEINI